MIYEYWDNTEEFTTSRIQDVGLISPGNGSVERATREVKDFTILEHTMQAGSFHACSRISKTGSGLPPLC